MAFTFEPHTSINATFSLITPADGKSPPALGSSNAKDHLASPLTMLLIKCQKIAPWQRKFRSDVLEMC